MSAEISQGPIIQGWCPGALRPMMSGDGLVVRIRAPLARLSQVQAHAVADLSRRFGNGLIDLSTRANLQLRGVTPETHPQLLSGLRDIGLLDQNVEVEARRNVTLPPFWQEGDETHRIASALNTALAQPDAPQTPGKFGYVVDCGDAPCLGDIAGDIRIERSADGALVCRPDGSDLAVPVTADTAASTALDLARWFLTSGGVVNKRGRMAAHIGKGKRPPAYVSVPLIPSVIAPQPGVTETGALLGLEFGQMTADMLDRIAGHGPIRLTPWRMVLVESCTITPEITGVVTTLDHPLARVFACTGAPGCPQALAPTRQLARDIAAHIPRGSILHVSGCAKGCAHPRKADLTLTATNASHFDLIRDGCASDSPDITGLTPSGLLDHFTCKDS